MSERTPEVGDPPLPGDEEYPMQIVECPVEVCRVPAEVVASWVVASGGQAVERRMTRCVTGHLVTPVERRPAGSDR